MSGVHKHPTISFRVSDREREMIEARILASGMQKKDYFVRSCIYRSVKFASVATESIWCKLAVRDSFYKNFCNAFF